MGVFGLFYFDDCGCFHLVHSGACSCVYTATKLRLENFKDPYN